jgi:hypothetical protein
VKPIVVLAIVLSGCATQPEVRVEKLPPPPTIIVPARPDLVGQPPSEQVRGVLDYILRLEAALMEALLALDVYR